MPYCEICGNECKGTYKRKIAGAIMRVCPNCKDMGSPVRSEERRRAIKHKSRQNQGIPTRKSRPQQSSRSFSSRRPRRRKKKKSIANMKLVDDYQDVLVKTRTKKGLSKDEFADELKVARSYYTRLEKGTTALPIKLAKKIEKMFHVKLTEEEEAIDENEYEQYLKKQSKSSGGGMVYFRKRGEEPEYDQ